MMSSASAAVAAAAPEEDDDDDMTTSNCDDDDRDDRRVVKVVHRGPSAIVHRLRLNGGRTIVAAKSLLICGETPPDADESDAEPSVEDVCRLNNEYNLLSGPLKGANNKTGDDDDKRRGMVRKVLGRACCENSSDGDGDVGGGGVGIRWCDGDGDATNAQPELLGTDAAEIKAALRPYGRHTVFLEWVDGVPLAEWTDRRFRTRLASQDPPKADDANGNAENNKDEVRVNVSIIQEMVQLMLAIADALSAVHASGVLHHDVSADNFIVSPDGRRVTIVGFGYATLWSMHEADDDGETVNDDLFGLGVLYRDLLKVIAGNTSKKKRRRSSTASADSVSSSTVHTMSRTSITHLAEEDSALQGVPRCLAALVSDLTKSSSPKGSCCSRANMTYLPDPEYTSATDVVKVLQRMLDNPGAFLVPDHNHDHNNSGGGGSHKSHNITFQSDVLYGRCEQIETLLDAYHTVSCPGNTSSSRAAGGGGNDATREGGPRMVTIAGSAGTGKSALLKKLGSYVTTAQQRTCSSSSSTKNNPQQQQQQRGFFAYGKYDQLQRNEPYSALVAALNGLCESIVADERDGCGVAMKRMKRDMHDMVGTEINVLMQLLPALSRILEGGGDDEESGNGDGGKPIVTDVAPLTGVEAMNRFKYVFRMFMRAVASRDRPVVLALDDVHWADDASLDLVRSVMADRGNASPLLLVLSYRHDDDTDDGHLLLRDVLRGIEDKQDVRVGNLNADELNAMVSDALRVPRLDACAELTGVVMRKTLGNVFFARQFLHSIVENDLLTFESKTWRWACDMNGISSLSMTDNVLGLLTSKIRDRLSEPVREVLELAACLGSTFDVPTLQLLLDSLPSTVTSATGQATEEQGFVDQHQKSHNLNWRMDVLVEEGLIVTVTPGVRYKFAHDRIQQAAYSTLQAERKAALHLLIGELVWANLRERSARWESHPRTHDETFFLAVDQMNKGSTEIVNTGKKVALAEFNLKAGQACIKKPAFQQAASYLKMGIALLDLGSCFEENYSLSLKLYNGAIEAEYCNGRVDEIYVLVDRVLANAKVFEDKLHAYEYLLRALGTQDKLREAIETGLEVLEMLGERFPRKEPVPKRTILLDFVKTKMALRGKSDDEFLSLPPMKNQTKVVAMRFIVTLMQNAYLGREDLILLFISRMVRMTLLYGVCESTPYVFSCFGMILVGAAGDVQGGFRFGRLALAFLERSAVKDYVAKVQLLVQYTINHWTLPLMQSVQPLLHSCRIGMEAGDIYYAMACAETSLAYAFFTGQSLHVLEQDARKVCQQMLEYRIEALHKTTLPTWQIMLNLLGRSDDPVMLSGEAMDQVEYLAEAVRIDKKHDITLVHLYSAYLAYFFGEYELAAQMAEKASDVKETILGSFNVCIHAYVEGLSAVALARSTKKRKWRRLARRALRRIKKWSLSSPNLLQMRLLLEAEFAVLQGKKSKAMHIYDAAIGAAAKVGCTQDEALSNERAGLFLMESGNCSKSAQYFVRAHQCYLRWGAQRKADHLYSQHMITSC